MKTINYLIAIAMIGLIACGTSETDLPKNHIGIFRLEKTQKIKFDGYSLGSYSQSMYATNCEDDVIFFITEDSIGIDPRSTCSDTDYSPYRWSYDKITVEDIQDVYIKDKYEQVSDLEYVIRYYPDSIFLTDYKGYFGVYKTSDYDISLINYDLTVLHFNEY